MITGYNHKKSTEEVIDKDKIAGNLEGYSHMFIWKTILCKGGNLRLKSMLELVSKKSRNSAGLGRMQFHNI